MRILDVRSLAVGLLLGGGMNQGGQKLDDELDVRPRSRSVEVRTIELPAGSEEALRFQKRIKSSLSARDVLGRVSLKVLGISLVIEWSKASDQAEIERMRDIVLDSVVSLLSEFKSSHLTIETAPLPSLHQNLGEWERASLRESQALRELIAARVGVEEEEAILGRTHLEFPSPTASKETLFRLKISASRPPSQTE